MYNIREEKRTEDLFPMNQAQAHMTLPPADQLLSLPELAKYLGICRSRLQRRIKGGYITADFVGNTYVTTLQAVVNSYTQGRRGPEPRPLPDAVIDHVRTFERSQAVQDD